MKLLTILTLCCAAVSATPVSLADHQGPNEVQELDVRKTVKKNEVQLFEKLQRAAGNTKLQAEKSYYFMSCIPFKTKADAQNPTLGEAEKWVRDKTRLPKSPYGCSHVGLIVGTVKTLEDAPESSGCLTCTRPSNKEFVGKYHHALIDSTDMWMIKGWPAKYSETAKIYFKGELQSGVNVEKLSTNTLLKYGQGWMKRAGNKFNKDVNCLTYYNELVTQLPVKKTS